jgi:hypothetical protein
MPTPSGRSTHQDVGELPGVTGIDVLRKQFAATLERRPVGVTPDHRAKIGPLQIQAAAEIHLVGLDDAALGFSSIQTMPASTAEVTCRPVAFW